MVTNSDSCFDNFKDVSGVLRFVQTVRLGPRWIPWAPGQNPFQLNLPHRFVPIKHTNLSFFLPDISKSTDGGVCVVYWGVVIMSAGSRMEKGLWTNYTSILDGNNLPRFLVPGVWTVLLETEAQLSTQNTKQWLAQRAEELSVC